MKSKKNLIILTLVIAISLIGVTYAFFDYSMLGSNQKITAGAVNLILNEGEDTINRANIFPETLEKARSRDDNFITFTVSGINTTEDEDIYYEIMLNEGDSEDGMTKFNPEDLVFDLVEMNDDGTEGEYLVDAMSYSDFNAKRIWVDTIDRNTSTTVEKTYKLRMWLSEDVLISDSNPNANYKATGYENYYASVKISVYGDFVEKNIEYLANKVKSTITLTEADVDGTRFVYGEVDNNYVWYSGKLWRIVSINNDGSIKLVTQGNMTSIEWSVPETAEDGTTTYNTDYSTSQIRNWLNNEFLPTLENSDELIADAVWDYTLYSSSTATKTTSINTVSDKVGLLTIYDYYKVRNGSNTNYLNNGYWWWTMSPQTSGSHVWFVDFTGFAGYGPANSFGARPSVSLKSGITILDGTGEKSNPYTIVGDKDTAVTSELLSNRISGEYINFNNTKYRIVGIEEVNGQQLTKVTMADYDVNNNTLSTSVAFGESDSDVTYNTSTGIGKYMYDWYQADSTSETYADTYIEDTYKAMIATDGIEWYTGPDDGIGYDYTLSKSGTTVETPIGLGYYGELFSSQFGDGYGLSTYTWLMTKYSGSNVWYVHNRGSAFNSSPTDSIGARPSFYLKSDVKITGGSGLPNNPYTLT